MVDVQSCRKHAVTYWYTYCDDSGRIYLKT